MKANTSCMKYSRSNTELLVSKRGHETSLSLLLHKEGLAEECTINEPVINGDDYMDSSSNWTELDSEKPKSVDIIFRLENNAIQFTECKLNIKPKLSSLSQRQLVDKVENTGLQLSKDLGINSFLETPPTPILFSNEVIERAKFRFRRWYPGKKESSCPFVAMRVADFIEAFF